MPPPPPLMSGGSLKKQPSQGSEKRSNKTVPSMTLQKQLAEFQGKDESIINVCSNYVGSIQGSTEKLTQLLNTSVELSIQVQELAEHGTFQGNTGFYIIPNLLFSNFVLFFVKKNTHTLKL